MLEQALNKLEDYRVGKWVFLGEELLSYLNQVYRHENRKMWMQDPSIGFYEIIKVERSPWFGIKKESGTPAMEVSLMMNTWEKSNPDIEPVVLILNHDADIVLGGQLLLNDCVFHAISTLKDLTDENNKRFTCISCSKPLNIISVNLKICRVCEESFANPVALELDLNEEIKDFEQDETTGPLDLDSFLLP